MTDHSDDAEHRAVQDAMKRLGRGERVTFDLSIPTGAPDPAADRRARRNAQARARRWRKNNPGQALNDDLPF